jgi:hypothetical protein
VPTIPVICITAAENKVWNVRTTVNDEQQRMWSAVTYFRVLNQHVWTNLVKTLTSRVKPASLKAENCIMQPTNKQPGISTLTPTWCTSYSIYYGLMASTCFEHYLLILKRCFTSNTWYTACVLFQLAASGLKWNWNSSILTLCRSYLNPYWRGRKTAFFSVGI